MSRRTLSITLALLAIATMVLLYAIRDTPTRNAISNGETYECDADGLVCPDGSVVGRTGPNCEFAACPGVDTHPHGAQPTNDVVVHGTVLISCPIAPLVPDPLCTPEAYVTDVLVISAAGKTVAHTRTASNGTYTLYLPPGAYTIRAQSGSPSPQCEDIEVALENGEHRTLNLTCDSQIKQ